MSFNQIKGQVHSCPFTRKGLTTMLMRTAKSTDDRMNRGLRLFQSDLVCPISPGCFVVASEPDDKVYYIVRSDTGCTCRDASERQMICKHQWAAFISAAMTIWRMADATSRAEIESLLALHTSPMPPGIRRTIELEAAHARERIAA
jgi:hypothetical protein